MIQMAGVRGSVVVVVVGILLVLSLAAINRQNEMLHPAVLTKPLSNIYYYQFKINTISGGSKSIVVRVDGISYPYSQLPTAILFNSNTRHNYSFSKTISSVSGIYVFNNVSGCGFKSISGTFNATQTCVASANYVPQKHQNTSTTLNTTSTTTKTSTSVFTTSVRTTTSN